MLTDVLWPVVTGVGLWVARQVFTQWLAHVVLLRTTEDTKRLDKLEAEVRSLNQVNNARGLGR